MLNFTIKPFITNHLVYKQDIVLRTISQGTQRGGIACGINADVPVWPICIIVRITCCFLFDIRDQDFVLFFIWLNFLLSPFHSSSHIQCIFAIWCWWNLLQEFRYKELKLTKRNIFKWNYLQNYVKLKNIDT